MKDREGGREGGEEGGRVEEAVRGEGRREGGGREEGEEDRQTNGQKDRGTEPRRAILRLSVGRWGGWHAACMGAHPGRDTCKG